MAHLMLVFTSSLNETVLNKSFLALLGKLPEAGYLDFMFSFISYA